ncbi:unnamed protein product, partial [Didymodactylos carnosus]
WLHDSNNLYRDSRLYSINEANSTSDKSHLLLNHNNYLPIKEYNRQTITPTTSSTVKTTTTIIPVVSLMNITNNKNVISRTAMTGSSGIENKLKNFDLSSRMNKIIIPDLDNDIVHDEKKDSFKKEADLRSRSNRIIKNRSQNEDSSDKFQHLKRTNDDNKSGGSIVRASALKIT